MFFLLALWLLAQAIDRKSVVYGILFAASLWLLAKVTTKISAITTILFFLVIGILIQTTPVQTWLVSTAAGKLSKSLHTEISIRRVSFSFFNKMILRDALVRDRNNDTLVYAGQFRVNITDWFFTKKSIELQYIGLTDATIKLQRKDSVWNYQFIADYFAGPKKKDTSSGIELHLKKIQLNNIHLLKKDEWRGEDMELRLASLLADADEIDLTRKRANINLLEFTEPSFAISNYTGRRPYPPPADTAEIKNDPDHLRWNAAGWDIILKSGIIKNGTFQDNKIDGEKPDPYFDGHHIYFSSINWDFKNVHFYKDTVIAQMQLSTKERSGITVRKLAAQIKVFPEAMEFAKLDLQTNKSHLRNFFAMRYKSFDDMSDFVTKVNMEGDFTDADVDSDDIAYFAPELKDWKKNIHLTGIIAGPVADLRGRNVLIAAGKNTLLNGDIHMKGLPDIDSTKIEFRSNEFRTNYKDMVTLIPQLKTVTQPRLDLIEYLRFKGTFNGYIKDFVTNGTIETNLGTLVTDVNMKLPDNKVSSYFGTLNTEDFDLGKFLDNDALGEISFSGKVNGTGLSAKTLNATLDGNVHNLHFNDYTYQDIAVNGAIAKRKFNGHLVSNDPNLQAQLNGLIDFSTNVPKFDFNAQIAQADFKKLNFTKEQIEFNGKVLFNFTGNTVDNFLGTARIYEGAIFKNGERISFDSLTVESSVVDNNKTITVESNEFDAALVGEFSISELPAAFQTFLNKYYPSYIKPVKTKLANQNFSFVITTKKVDDYIDLFEKNTRGFNNTTISGRINTKENLFDLNAEVPQFSYKNISFYNVNLKGNGNLDSLSSDATIGEVYVNDSLHFPSTHIQLHSAADVSDVKITTSANQTLNSANIAAQVKTLRDGVRIKFKPSTFDVNSKNWTIDKDGELVISNSIAAANNLRIYSDEQQVLITTHPSTKGNWNDVHIDLKKINIGDFTPYFVKGDRLEGLLTGTTEIADPFGAKQNITFSGRTEQFRLNDDSLGKIDITGNYDKTSGLVNAQVNSDNKNYQFDLNAVINTRDSASVQPVNITLNLKDTKIDLLEKYLNSVFTNISGYASGKLQIAGPGNQLKYIGKLQLR
ncbi:MAG: hypothetical protein JST96_04175, partial [Bacteroidetes bacterium]|nr:hypothetical protein [Bacteroidota bacterium]